MTTSNPSQNHWTLPDAVMSTTGRGRYSVLRIFKGRRGRTGHHETCGALPAAGPYLRLSRFQGGQADHGRSSLSAFSDRENLDWEERKGRDESERQRAESQRIVAARPLCRLQYPVAYLSRLQRILPAARWKLYFKAANAARPLRGLGQRHVPLGA
ncbi:Hypothetical predicted protein, partial [Olea europaea subsp. europaea]